MLNSYSSLRLSGLIWRNLETWNLALRSACEQVGYSKPIPLRIGEHWPSYPDLVLSQRTFVLSPRAWRTKLTKGSYGMQSVAATWFARTPGQTPGTTFLPLPMGGSGSERTRLDHTANISTGSQSVDLVIRYATRGMLTTEHTGGRQHGSCDNLMAIPEREPLIFPSTVTLASSRGVLARRYA